MEPPTLHELLEELRIPPVLLEQTCSDEHLKSISLFLDWRRVAPHLGLSETDIEEIDFEKRTGAEKRLKTLQQWKGKLGYRAKFYDLVQVLLKVGNADHAGRVCRLLHPAQLHEDNSFSSEAAIASSDLTNQPHSSPALLARQQPPISRVEALSLTAISPMKTIESEIEELEDQFLEVVNEAEDMLENSQQLKKVKRCITQLPVSVRYQHIKFLQSNLTAINSASSIGEIFAVLGLYWNFLNCGLLREIIRRLGDRKTKQLMGEYSEKLKSFRERTKLGDFINKWTGDCNFCHKEFCTEMGEEWRERSLEDLEKFRMQFSRQMSFTDYAVLIRKVGSGSVIVSWVLQHSFPLTDTLFLGALQLLRESSIQRVTSNGEVILELRDPKFRLDGATGKSRIRELQLQLDEVKGVMVQNIEKVTQRGDKQADLGERAEYLSSNADIFQRTATRQKRRKNMKVIVVIIIIIIILVVLAAIIIAIAVPVATK